MKKKVELTYARAIFCVIIVIVHAMTGFVNDPHITEFQKRSASYIQVLLFSATPCFIMLSEMLLGMRYSKHIPNNFLTKRVKFILIPYICFALFVIVEIYFDPSKNFSMSHLLINILLEGKFFGWFVLVIFQFFVIHMLFYKVLDRMKPLIPIVVSLVISFGHAFLMYYSTTYLEFWNTYYPLFNRTIILNWLFYFVIGFYIGKNFDAVMQYVQQKVLYVLGALLLSGLVIAFDFFVLNVTWRESNRFDLFIFTAAFFVLAIYVAKQLSRYHLTALYMISEISFFIYLSHQIIIQHISRGLASFVKYPFAFFTLTTIFTLGFCVGLAIILSFFPYVRIVVGRNTLYPMVLNNYSIKPEEPKSVAETK